MKINIFNAALITVILITLSSCNNSCSFELIYSVKSPVGNKTARFVRGNCGATTGYKYEVRISKDSDSALEDGKAVLRFDDNHAENWPVDERQLIALTWSDDKKLHIAVLRPVRVFMEDDSAQGVDVNYQYSLGTSKL